VVKWTFFMRVASLRRLRAAYEGGYCQWSRAGEHLTLPAWGCIEGKIVSFTLSSATRPEVLSTQDSRMSYRRKLGETARLSTEATAKHKQILITFVSSTVISLKLRFGIATPKDNIWTHRDRDRDHNITNLSSSFPPFFHVIPSSCRRRRYPLQPCPRHRPQRQQHQLPQQQHLHNHHPER
jgi:hypothetical protein